MCTLQSLRYSKVVHHSSREIQCFTIWVAAVQHHMHISIFADYSDVMRLIAGIIVILVQSFYLYNVWQDLIQSKGKRNNVEKMITALLGLIITISKVLLLNIRVALALVLTAPDSAVEIGIIVAAFEDRQNGTNTIDLFYFPMSTVYVNTLLATLNARHYLRSLNSTPTQSIFIETYEVAPQDDPDCIV
ncbi:hypothetical protein WOLCODRAFT_21373 [Wolfiporia cocos MD-104 SS10]|uniref:DUF6534 domain-containing protein n=1 Tax=Wolfiporia cocos (strain MD-104) TaxID=742152 RepID=A0A2H3JA83_WOLCO|nr:hypothetical protein WOLCODRAFT_21373 [Wolfiporia cocos MD-104 SS10]